MFGGKCAYCGIQLPEKGWHVDHIEPIIRDTRYVYNHETGRGGYKATGKVHRPENENADNYFPSCAPCNINKGPVSLIMWRQWLQDRMIDSMRERLPNFRHAERFGRITVNTEPLVFWFEKWKDEHAD